MKFESVLAISLVVFSAMTCVSGSASEEEFEKLFTGKTLRFDYYHSGTAGQEEISPDGFRLESDWPGRRSGLVDRTNMGKYLFEVRDLEGGDTLFSQGFSSIYGEWETTGEASSGLWRTFHESQRFPEPRTPVEVVLLKRTSQGDFSEIFATRVDPAGRLVNRAPLPDEGELTVLFRNGPVETKVDLLVLASGYGLGESGKFLSDTRRLTSALFETEPFTSRQEDFNLRALHIPAPDSGISDPRRGIWRDDPLGLSFNALGLDRYVLTQRNRQLREAAAFVPYDALVIIFNSPKYGGGGIFNLWATAASDTAPSAYVFVHEFGHSFGGLADEYYSSEVTYENFIPPGKEPWEPNVTALLNPEELKWKELVDPHTPLPTPWNQAAYDRVAVEYQQKRKKLQASQGASDDHEMEELFEELERNSEDLYLKEPYAGKIGAFEGASYQSKGLYRPALDCIMFSRNSARFCRVCRRALERMIDLHIGRQSRD